MELPKTFVVPDFILENVRVAPEEWPEATTPDAAKVRLKELLTSLQNPDILYGLCQVVNTLAQASNSVFEHQLHGFSDMANQQQLIGEVRGLRSFLSIITDIQEKLVYTATNTK